MTLQTSHRSPEQAFTLIEILVVTAILALILSFLAPALTTLKGASDITTSAHAIADRLQQARTHAMANNTYVWVGFYEENYGTTTATNTQPPFPGRGRVVIASVSSIDGTQIFDDSDTPASLPTARITVLSKLLQLEGIHVVDIGAPVGGDPETVDGRPNPPYTDGQQISADHYNRISSESSDTTRFPFTALNYTFYKTVRFNPRGEAQLNSTYSLKRRAEIGLRPTHGNLVDVQNSNVVAIQFSGVTGNFKVYRK